MNEVERLQSKITKLEEVNALLLITAELTIADLRREFGNFKVDSNFRGLIKAIEKAKGTK